MTDYFVFAWGWYEASGGAQDCVGIGSSPQAAEALGTEALARGLNYAQIAIVSSGTLEVVGINSGSGWSAPFPNKDQMPVYPSEDALDADALACRRFGFSRFDAVAVTDRLRHYMATYQPQNAEAFASHDTLYLLSMRGDAQRFATLGSEPRYDSPAWSGIPSALLFPDPEERA